jgi:hypothetical protein
MSARRTVIESEINSPAGGGVPNGYVAPFAVTTPSGTTGGASVSLAGTAPSGAFKVVVDGHPEAVLTWTNQTTWTLSGIILKQGLNALTVRMLDHLGATVGTPIVYNFTKTGNAVPVINLVIDPGSANVALGELLTLDASTSYDPDGTALSFNWTVPTANVVVTAPAPNRRLVTFSKPGRYLFTVVATDSDSGAAVLTREITVFNTADFESYGEKLIQPFWTLQNLKLRDSYAPSAWYSLEDKPGRALIQTLDNAAKPLVYTNPAYPAMLRPLPATDDFVLQTDLEYDAKRLGSHYTGLQVDTVENGVAVRYTIGVENGTTVVAKRGTASTAFTNQGTSQTFTGISAVLRVRRAGTALLFDRRVNGAWSNLLAVTLPAGSTAVRGGPFIATTAAENLRIAFDYVLLADPGNISTPLSSIRITEVMYAPKAPGTVEFIELQNVGAAPVNLQNCNFPDGDPFDSVVFGNLTLNPGQFAVVTNSVSAFQARYGTGITIAGEWGISSSLNNAGELVILLDPDGNEIHRFIYANTAPWPIAANGQGPSMEVVDLNGNYSSGANWRASFEIGGSPGYAGAGPDTDGDGQPDSYEAMFGTDPNNGSSRFAATVVNQGAAGSQISFPSVAGRSYRVDYCDDLVAGQWYPLQTIGATGALTSVNDATIPKPDKRFYRVVPL